MRTSIVFIGSGPVAAESLRQLKDIFTIEAIITKPSTITEMSAIHDGIPVHAVGTRKELDVLISDMLFESKLAILIDFGIIVSRAVIDSFPLGIINSHFSILPEWRGADPISFAILSGQPKTGVSLMLLDEGMDTGKIITSKRLTINAGETTPSLTERLITLSTDLLNTYVPGYITGDIKARQQPHPDRATYSRKLTKEDGLINWSKSAEVIEREVRAFITWPKSRTSLGGKDVIITKAHTTSDETPNSSPGKPIIDDQTKELGIATGNGILWIDELKPAGKKEMPAKAFLAGYRHLL